MQDKDKSDGSSSASAFSVFKLLDKAAEFDWTLKFAGAFLFADAAMVAADKKNLMNWDWSTSASVAHIGFAITAFLVYSLCVSLALPVISAVCQWVIWQLPALPRWIDGEKRYDRSFGYVTDSELQARADEEQSSYLRDKLDRAKDERRQTVASVGELGRISFATLVFFVANIFVVDADAAHTATGLFLSALDSDHRRTLEMLVLGVLLVPTWYAWTYEDGLHWIPYQPLYDEIIAKRRAAEQAVMRP